MQLVFAVLAVVLFCLAGLNVRAPRFAPEWFAAACAIIAVLWPLFDALG